MNTELSEHVRLNFHCKIQKLIRKLDLLQIIGPFQSQDCVKRKDEQMVHRLQLSLHHTRKHIVIVKCSKVVVKLFEVTLNYFFFFFLNQDTL